MIPLIQKQERVLGQAGFPLSSQQTSKDFLLMMSVFVHEEQFHVKINKAKLPSSMAFINKGYPKLNIYSEKQDNRRLWCCSIARNHDNL